MDAMFFDWQFVAVVICIAVALIVIVRRVMRLFGEASPKGCSSGGCSSCPSNQSDKPHDHAHTDFVPLQTLVNSSHSAHEGPRQ